MAMHTWFECKIRYEKVMENGMQKKVTEPYLVDALILFLETFGINSRLKILITAPFNITPSTRYGILILNPDSKTFLT